MIWTPSVENVKNIHYEIVKIFENEEDPVSPPGVKSEALLESACNRPHTGAGNVYKYDTIYRKCAALFHSLTKNHAFHNGNKRTAVVTLLTTLQRNDQRLALHVTDDDIYNIAIEVTDDTFPKGKKNLSTDQRVEEIAKWIKSNSTSMSPVESGMKTSDFISRCEQVGATKKYGTGGTIVIQYKRKKHKDFKKHSADRRSSGQTVFTTSWP